MNLHITGRAETCTWYKLMALAMVCLARLLTADRSVRKQIKDILLESPNAGQHLEE